MKRFGFHPDQLYFNMRNPTKVRYLKDKRLGNFEAPMKSKTKNLHALHQNYQDRLDFEKYMNPKGLKPTITSRFKKPSTEIEFVSHNLLLHRSPKPYTENEVSFRCNDFMSKPEIRQYLSKLYSMPIQSVTTSRKMGKMMVNSENRTGWRKKDWKKATVTLDYEVDPEYQKII